MEVDSMCLFATVQQAHQTRPAAKEHIYNLYSISIISKICSSLASVNIAVSAFFLLISVLANGDKNEIFPFEIFASSTPTI
jgi:hypothetical protein